MGADGEEPPVLPPGGNVSNLEFLGCIAGYLLVLTVILGLPIAIVFGVTLLLSWPLAAAFGMMSFGPRPIAAKRVGSA